MILMVGKMANPTISQMFESYTERIKHYVPTEVSMVFTKTTAKQMAQQRDEEGKLILNQIKPEDYVVLLDDKGTEYTSMKFARWIEQKQNSVKRLVLVIGGAYGFSQEIYDRANALFSLSKLTFPHQLVRIILAEQIYRAYTIIKNEQYHHEDSLLLK